MHASLKKIVSLALPMAGTQLITTASGFLCMTMLATLGHDVLAASALIFSTQISLTVTGMSILFCLSFLIGHDYGAQRYQNIGTLVQQGWTLGLLISIPLLLIFSLIGPILVWMGQPKSIVTLVQTFFYAHNWRVIPLMLGVCNQQLCYGVRKQRLDLITNILGVFVLLFVSYILILGKWGFPSLGVAGLGYAMAAQSWFYFLFTTICFYIGKDFQHFHLFRYRVHKEWKTLIHLFKVGWPICIHIGGELMSFFVTAMMVGWLGVNSLAAYQIVIQYLFFSIIPIFAISQAGGVLIGHACGSKQFSEIRNLGHASLWVGLSVASLIAFIFFFFPVSLASLYINVDASRNAEIMYLTILFFTITAFSQFLDAIRNILTGNLRGLLDTQFPMYASLFAIWIVGIPLSYLLGFTLAQGLMGIALGSTISMLVGAGILSYRWHTLSRKISESPIAN